MEKFFSNLVGGDGKKNNGKGDGKKQPSKDAPKNSWQGGVGDMETMKRKNAPVTVSNKVDSSKNILANAGAGINEALGKIDLFKKKDAINRGGGQSLGGFNRVEGTSGKSTLDANARKQAVIAAAEAREAKHKATQKPIPKSERKKDGKELKHDQIYDHQIIDSEETRRAVAAAKQAEKEDALTLGYNPYEAKAMTSGQARTATVAMVKGEINADNAPSKIIGSGEAPSPGKVHKPRAPTSIALEPPPEFEHAFSILVTSNTDHAAVLKSLSTMRTLIKNATTKGQQGDDETSSKYRRVRLSNTKIKDTITDMQGALELMMSVGFVLSENDDDGETYLVYPPGEKEASWLGTALEMIESYENGGTGR